MKAKLIPAHDRARVAELEAAKPKYGVLPCEWCTKPYARRRPWARFCSPECRMAYWEAYHPRTKDAAHGRKAKAKAVMGIGD